jgi:hypothetical protein
MVQPPMNADKRRLKTHNLSAFICVYQRPICLFQQPVRGGVRVATIHLAPQVKQAVPRASLE